MDALAFVIPFLGLLILLSMLACKLVRNYGEVTRAREQQQQAQIALQNAAAQTTTISTSKLSKINSIDGFPTGIKIAFMPTGQLMYAKPTLSEMSVEQVQAGDSVRNSKLASQGSGVVMYKTEISLSVQSVDLDELKSADSIMAQRQSSQNKQILSESTECSINNY